MEIVTIHLKQAAYLFLWCPEICVVSICVCIFSPQKNREWYFILILQPRDSSTFICIRIPLNILKMQLAAGVVPATLYF